jgi:hypothetical protein
LIKKAVPRKSTIKDAILMGTNRKQAVDDKGNNSDYTTTILQPLAKFHSPSFESHGEDTE